MVTFIVICAFLVAILAIIAAIAFFVNTAMILLPWTIPATGLGAAAGFAAGWKVPLSESSRPLVGGCITFVLVMGLGYAGLAVAPLKVQPLQQNDPLNLFPVKAEDVTGMIPMHMGISAAIGAVGVVIALGSMKTKRLVLELDDEPATTT